MVTTYAEAVDAVTPLQQLLLACFARLGGACLLNVFIGVGSCCSLCDFGEPKRQTPHLTPLGEAAAAFEASSRPTAHLLQDSTTIWCIHCPQ